MPDLDASIKSSMMDSESQLSADVELLDTSQDDSVDHVAAGGGGNIGSVGSAMSPRSCPSSPRKGGNNLDLVNLGQHIRPKHPESLSLEASPQR